CALPPWHQRCPLGKQRPSHRLIDDGPPATHKFSPPYPNVGNSAITPLLNGAVSLYEYMFGAVLGAELTAKQGVIFGYLARLLLVVPGATITTLIDFLEEPENVRPYLPKLHHPFTRRFF